MENKEYILSERVNNWKTAIGLQAVDGLKPSEYLYELAGQHIEGKLDIDEVRGFLKEYYGSKDLRIKENAQSEEADKVSSNIIKLLEDNRFSVCTEEYRSIHESLFYGVFPHAGQYRTVNISKREWVLQWDTVNYAQYPSIMPMLDKAMEAERSYHYNAMELKDNIEHLSRFIADIWQIHPFREGNTRTTAVFTIKYLRSMGYDIDNEMFRNHSWYFRNALVRANYTNHKVGVLADMGYLHRFFHNLLGIGSYELHNHDMLLLQ